MNYVEKKFETESRKLEEYTDTRYYDGDRVLRWKSSSGNARQLERVAHHGLPPHGSESSTTRHGGSWRPSYVRRDSEKVSGRGYTFVLSVENDNDFRSRCE